MLAIASVLLILALSILVTRIATVALTHTGMSREAARFQARSAFTGVGFTTGEAEQVAGHPVRRRIVMLLMLAGSAGIVTVLGTLILGFTVRTEGGYGLGARLGLLGGGVLVLWLLAVSPLVDRWLSRLIGAALRRWTRLDTRDYEALLHLQGDYGVRELLVAEDDWMQGRTLGELKLRDEGLNVLGVERSDGCYLGAPKGDTRIQAGDVLLVYGRERALARLDERRDSWEAARDHEQAVEEQRTVAREEAGRDAERPPGGSRREGWGGASR